MTQMTAGRVLPISIDSAFDSVVRDFFNTMSRTPFTEVVKKGSYPRVDIRETETEAYLDATVPGLQRSDISIDFEDGHLKLSADKQSDLDGEFLHREIHRSSFSRWFPIDTKVYDVENITATLRDGILTIKVPKRPEAVKPAPRKIEVR